MRRYFPGWRLSDEIGLIVGEYPFPMHSYRTLDAWKRAHSVALLVLEGTDKGYHARARELFAQLKRAAISIEANIVEGYALNTPPLFRRHLRIAIGSAAEAECLVRLARERGYLDAAIARHLEQLLGNTIGTLVGLMRGLPKAEGGPARK